MLEEERCCIGLKGKSIAECFESFLSKKEKGRILAAYCNGEMRDLSYTLLGGEKLSPIFLEDKEALDLIRHSTAHIMASAVKKLFPNAKVSIGPSISTGFYYDFDVEKAFTAEDLPKIEKEMELIVAENFPFIRKDITKEEARALFEKESEPYKIELLEAISEDSVSIYSCGDFTDLCRGPHVPSTGFLSAFSLLSVAGAYFRGDENNAMLSRIYGTAFPSNKELKEYLLQIEEAKKRDHRKLGAQLELFGFQEQYAPGMVYWYPKGMLLRTILESLLKKEHLRRSYNLVQGPQLLRRSLWEKSGHYDNYKENMYFTEIEGDLYGVKPMNCVSHMLIYKSKMHSYRELPVRLFELGVVHRHEKSGTLHGLMRVRQFTQDDAHIICMPEQLEDELVGVLLFIKDLLRLFNFSYRVEISTRPEKSIGSDEDWESATSALIGAAKREKINYTINEGDGAFYGPKIDVKLLDCIGREWQCSTVQCDFTLPERFELSYTGKDGEKHKPVMVHRAIFGSIERFIGILTEHYAGAFPVWLSPVQASIITITDDHNEFASSVYNELIANGVRVTMDSSNNKLGYKIRLAQLEKIPYILVIGDKEVQDETVNVRLRSGENLGPKTVQELHSLIEAECMQPFINGGIGYKFF